MSSIVLYQYPKAGHLESLSPFCVKVHLALLHKGLDYKVKNLMTPGQVKKVNSRGRLPAADIDGKRIVDSSEILAALEEKHPELSLWPEDPYLKARAGILEDWADEVVYFYLVYWRWLIESPPSSAFQSVPGLMRPMVKWFIRRTVKRRLSGQGIGLKSVQTIKGELNQCLEKITALVEGSESDFLLGTEGPTIADIALFSQIDGMRWEVLAGARKVIDGYDKLMAWYGAVEKATRGKKD